MIAAAAEYEWPRFRVMTNRDDTPDNDFVIAPVIACMGHAR